MITDIYNNLVWYQYKDDEVAWDGEHYLSLLSGGSFTSLEELDDFWNSYNIAQYSEHSIVVTKDMAIDAGDMSLEGQVWQW